MELIQSRRTFIRNVPLLLSLSASLPAWAHTGKTRKKRVLLRSSWQTFNIGDIAHTPGLLALLEKYLPDTEVWLWPMDVGNGVDNMLHRRFPQVKMVHTEADIMRAFRECDFLLHGSGPSLVGRAALSRWGRETGKPYGVYGITFPGIYAAKDTVIKASPQDIDLLSKAAFVFFRDSVSLDFARNNNVTCPVMEFAPDATFAVDIRNDRAALAFMQEHGLVEGNFLCCIPRLRFTPEWLAKGKNRPYVPERAARNEVMKEHDNAPLRNAITAIVRQTSMKVLVCPEDESQVALGKEIIVDLLPEDVKKKVVWREKYWLTDEALSTYRRSAGLFGMEMHSPIICIGQHVPAIVCRFYEQSTKGFMWRDIGLNDWLFDMDVEEDVKRIVPTVLSLANDPAAAREKAGKAALYVEQRQRETMQVLQELLYTH